MPARKDIKKILIIGSGPIIIGQACEFDYSGNQAVQALKEANYSIIVHNPNPASVMTIKERADAVYMDPLTVDYVEAIIKRESPDAILPTMGGQTALNLALELHSAGLDKQYSFEFLGAKIPSIQLAEDRGLFKEKMTEIGLESPFSQLVNSEHQAVSTAKEIGYPIIIRPSFTLGGKGGGIAYNEQELRTKIRRALMLSHNHTALVEESLIGYQEYEFEVMRDGQDNALVVCAIENVDPMGVHTGDSITVAPIQTLSDQEYQRLRSASLEILRAVKVDCGGSNVQLAYHSQKKRMLVIEMNPRVSRSSALASKATGFPIARCAAKLAVGYTLDEITNEITGVTTTFFEPALDYVAVKVPRFELSKFSLHSLGTQMRSVGEALALARTFPAALNKAIRAIEQGYECLQPLPYEQPVIDNIIDSLHPLRIFAIYTDLLRRGKDAIVDLEKRTHYGAWFLYQLWRIADIEVALQAQKKLDPILLEQAKEIGFTNTRIAQIRSTENNQNLDSTIDQIDALCDAHNITTVYHCVDTCAGEFKAKTPYFYGGFTKEQDEASRSPVKLSARSSSHNNSHIDAVAIIGSGPNRIGQGLEFDSCCTMAALSFRKRNTKVVMINSNPETVSTDYNISDRLYLEPLHPEDVHAVLQKEGIMNVVVQFGGQTPIKMLSYLEQKGITALGCNSDIIHLAEDRERFSQLLTSLAIKQPPNCNVMSVNEIASAIDTLGYPVLVRPSYVIGGQAMQILYNDDDLKKYIETNADHIHKATILVDSFLKNAIEYDVDAVTDGRHVYIGGVLEHIEHAGVHSGDSACVLRDTVPMDVIAKKIYHATKRIALAMSTLSQKKSQAEYLKGLLNIQFAAIGDELYVLEVNPRSSRTVPFLCKTTGVDLVDMAVGVWHGETLNNHTAYIANTYEFEGIGQIGVGSCAYPSAVKEAVFSFDKFEEVDPILTPEMRSTGESIGIGQDFGESFAKASASASTELARAGTVFITLSGEYKTQLLQEVQLLCKMGFKVVATKGTAEYLSQHDVSCRAIKRITEGSPNIIDIIRQGEIDFMVNILNTSTKSSITDDSAIRLAAVQNRIPYVTSIPAFRAALEGIQHLKKGTVTAHAL